MSLGEEKWLLKPASTNDLSQILRIETTLSYDVWSRKSSEAEQRDPSGMAHLWIVVPLSDRCQVAGYSAFRVIFDELYILKVVVDPKWRRKGAARFMLSNIIGYGQRNGCRRFLLDVRSNNRPAVRLYESMGFSLAVPDREGNSGGIMVKETD